MIANGCFEIGIFILEKFIVFDYQQVALISSLKTSNLKCDFNHVEFRDTLLPPYETMLLCSLAQDALTYIIRHTSSDVAHIDLSTFNRNCWLIFIYNGEEYSMQQSLSGHLEMIRETAALLGATLTFEASKELCNKMVIKLGMLA